LESNISDTSLLPSGFHFVGHVALLHLKKEIMKYAEIIGQLTLEFDKRIKSVAVRSGPTIGVKRLPSYSLVAGDKKTETIHIENGIRFKLDPLNVTFSGGNKEERIRMPSRIKTGEVIVDMFACVGQFALHLAKKKTAKVYAIELNSIAYDYLLENITLNHLDNYVQAINGDCREVYPRAIADRIVMGYLHDTLSYFPYALKSLKKCGGFVHMHLAGLEKDIPNYCNTINTICNSEGFNVISDETRKIKHYSPRIDHFVFDIEVQSAIQ